MEVPVLERISDTERRTEGAIFGRVSSDVSGWSDFEVLNDKTSPFYWVWDEKYTEPLIRRQSNTGVGSKIWRYRRALVALQEKSLFMEPVSVPVVMPHEVVKPQKDEEVERVFNALMDEWRGETEHMSSTSDILLHPAHLKIIGLGPKAVPLLLRELRDRLYHLFSALSAITREDLKIPEGKGRVKRLTEAWLTWGKQRGYL